VFPVLPTVKAGTLAVPLFVRSYPRQTIAAAVIYAVTATLSALVLPRLPINFLASGHVKTWLGTLIALVLMAPIWTSVYRFVVLGDTEHRYWPPDMRSRRVLTVLVILSAITMIGGLPFVFIIDLMPRLTIRKLAIAGILLGVVAAKLVFLWLTLRLSIAAPMGAAGTRPNPLDTSFGYTRGAVMRIFATKGLVYLPLIVMILLFMLAARLTNADLMTNPVTLVVITIATAITDFVEAATFSLVARRLARKRPPG
jgi:hypothetical protein